MFTQELVKAHAHLRSMLIILKWVSERMVEKPVYRSGDYRDS